MSSRLLKNRMLLGYFLTLVLSVVVLSFVICFYSQRNNDRVIDIKSEAISSMYSEKVSRVERSIEGLSRSVYVFDTVMSKDDYSSRFLYSVAKSDELIFGSRVVVDEKVYGDRIHDELDSWYKEVKGDSKLRWSGAYEYKGNWLRDVYFPVFYNQKVVAYVSYSVNVNEMFDGIDGIDFSYVSGSDVIYETSGFVGDSFENRRGNVKFGKDTMYYLYDNIHWFDYIKEFKWVYGLLFLLVSVSWMLIGWIYFTFFGRIDKTWIEVSRSIEENDINRLVVLCDDSKHSDIVGYELIKGVRDLLHEFKREKGLAELLDLRNEEINDIKDVNRKLRTLYVKNKGDLDDERVRYLKISEELDDAVEKSRLLSSEIGDYETRERMYTQIYNDVYKRLDELRLNNFESVCECDLDVIEVLNDCEYQLRLVLADMYSLGFSDMYESIKTDTVVDRLEKSILSVGKIKDRFDCSDQEVDELVDFYRDEQVRLHGIVDSVKSELVKVDESRRS